MSRAELQPALEEQALTPWEIAAPLVRAAQAGDVIALNDLMELLLPYVGRLCRPIALAESADAIQEALIVVFRGIGGLKDPSALYGWVRTITVREAVRVARRASRETPVPDVGDQPVLADSELATDVHDVLGRLSSEHRAILVLRELEGLSEQAAGEVLGLARGTVKSRLSRARSSFRTAWTA
ncbi:RNA polymerase sigma factor (sigma-70 family) [Kitasatospora sp. MAA4]|uniref:RNA polymerase sigma factor n=1 Tax=Kitasatospora sp. MAA4 TaxID=3035093 RepID=UPI002476FA30|nr:RNA polymerase sigma factor [Kitasatospora sp. MAA4]MDH6134187.1 RNA polymerase sigma factor (sigma-70 family) [Kitasatospora sp. MAA4]